MKTIIHAVDLEAPRERVFAAISPQAGLSRWWTTSVEADERVGGTVAFTFGGGTCLLFRQEYAQELSDVQYGTYNFNWDYYLESLRRYCDLGEGAPYLP